jgi:unsaturated rhamnogalacturonyl hydrolase
MKPNMKFKVAIRILKFFLVAAFPIFSRAQTALSAAQIIANKYITIEKDSAMVKRQGIADWNYAQSMVLQGMIGLWKQTGDGKYFKFIQKDVDLFNKNKRTNSCGVNYLIPARELLLLFRVTGKKQYLDNIDSAYKKSGLALSIKKKSAGGEKDFSKDNLAEKMYIEAPFTVAYARTFHKPALLSNIAGKYLLEAKNIELNSYGYSAAGLGLYGMALVDALDNFPNDQKEKKELALTLKSLAAYVMKMQDKNSGLWWHKLKVPSQGGNYLDSSASCMFIYTLLKGVRTGVLPASCSDVAQKAFKTIRKEFLKKDIVNNPETTGAFLLAANEIEMLSTLSLGKGNVVLLDYYFNHETKKDVTGASIPFHYVWKELDNGGYSMFGNIFNKYGLQTKTIERAPSLQLLKKASIYIIVDPDTKKETERPNYMGDGDINTIYSWVKSGGILMLFNNDSGNAEFTHFNKLAEKFGIQFNYDSKNHVLGNQYEMGAIQIDPGNLIFKSARKVYIKEYSSLAIHSPAAAVLKDGKAIVAAVARIGKGAVFAVGDPWFYNEYEDGRKIPVEFENYKAAEDLIKWLIYQINGR